MVPYSGVVAQLYCAVWCCSALCSAVGRFMQWCNEAVRAVVNRSGVVQCSGVVQWSRAVEQFMQWCSAVVWCRGVPCSAVVSWNSSCSGVVPWIIGGAVEQRSRASSAVVQQCRAFSGIV